MKKVTGLSAWTNLSFLDAWVEYNGHEYQWQGIIDGKLSTYEICDDTGTPVEDKLIWAKVSDIAIQTLESKDNTLLNDVLDKIIYEG